MSTDTGFGIDLDDLGLSAGDVDATPVTSARPVHDAAAADPKTVTAGSPLARALYEVWSGRDIVVVKSPPGAGKSTLICEAIAQLHRRSDLTVTLATPTRRGAFELAERLGADLGKAPNGDPRVVLAMPLRAGEALGPNVARHGAGSALSRRVEVRTIASCAAKPPERDLLVVDEAYQAVFAQVALASEKATQLLLVGDPGQIGPVVQSDTTAWSGMSAAPHMRAPEVFEQDPEAIVLRLPSTYRIGPVTAAAIAPLYDFQFDSQRSARHVVDGSGRRLPEIRSALVEADSEFDMQMLARVASEAAAFIGMSVVEETPAGPVSRVLDASDVAVVVARSGQESAVTAMLRRIGAHTADVTVGTADRLQGGQWHAVVAVDPLLGSDQVDDFRTGPGRLCVMASRAMSHLLWLHDGQWEQSLTGGAADPDQAAKGLAVRRALCQDRPVRGGRLAA